MTREEPRNCVCPGWVVVAAGKDMAEVRRVLSLFS